MKFGENVKVYDKQSFQNHLKKSTHRRPYLLEKRKLLTLFLEDDHRTERKEIACVFQHIWNDFLLLTKERETIFSCKVMIS